MAPAEIVAHRGASAYAPEHTFEAYDLALRMGADMVELDVRLTRDGRLVVLHDATLARTSGDPRRIRDVGAAELSGPLRPLALEEVLDRYGPVTRLLIELKEPRPPAERRLIGALRERRLLDRVTVQSFDGYGLRRVRRLEPAVDLARLFCETSTREQVLARLRATRRYASAIGVFHATVDRALVGAAHTAGLAVRAFTVNREGDMERLLACGVDGLITDVPDVARAAALRLPAAVAA